MATINLKAWKLSNFPVEAPGYYSDGKYAYYIKSKNKAIRVGITAADMSIKLDLDPSPNAPGTGDVGESPIPISSPSFVVITQAQYTTYFNAAKAFIDSENNN